MSESDPAPELDADLLEAVDDLLARERILVAVDYDGTLAPIVENPDEAVPLPAALEALRALSEAPGTSVAVVSGRALDRLRRFVSPAGAMLLVGSHGAEVDAGSLDGGGTGDRDGTVLDADGRRSLERLRQAVGEIVRAYPGTSLEQKPAAVVLHTRTADRESALGATGDVLLGPARWPGVHVLRGK